MGSPAFRLFRTGQLLTRRFPVRHACTLWQSRVKSRWNNSCHNWCYSAEKRKTGGMKRQQLLILAILLFFSVVILGCLCMMTIPSPTTGGPAFVF